MARQHTRSEAEGHLVGQRARHRLWPPVPLRVNLGGVYPDVLRPRGAEGHVLCLAPCLTMWPSGCEVEL